MSNQAAPELYSKVFSTIFGTDSSWFWAMCQFIVITISLIFIYRQLRIQRQANALSSLKSLDDKWRSINMAKARYAVCKKCGHDDKKIRHNEENILDFFEEMGLFLKRKVFDKKAIWEFYSYYIEHYWPILQPKIVEIRAETQDKTWFSNFEYLYKKCVLVSNKKGTPDPTKTEDRIKKFPIRLCQNR